MNPKSRIFIFTIRRTYSDKVRETKFQVPAFNRDQALIKLGQNFPNEDDNYVLELIEG